MQERNCIQLIQIANIVQNLFRRQLSGGTSGLSNSSDRITTLPTGSLQETLIRQGRAIAEAECIGEEMMRSYRATEAGLASRIDIDGDSNVASAPLQSTRRTWVEVSIQFSNNLRTFTFCYVGHVITGDLLASESLPTLSVDRSWGDIERGVKENNIVLYKIILDGRVLYPTIDHRKQYKGECHIYTFEGQPPWGGSSDRTSKAVSGAGCNQAVTRLT